MNDINSTPEPEKRGHAGGLGIRFGRFRLVERVGQGGMSEVWRADAPRPDGPKRLYALKRILPDARRPGELVKVFAEDARTCGLLNHQNIVKVHELGSVEGACYLAMEFLDGHDLEAVMTVLAAGSRRMPIPVAAFIVREVARGLTHAHELCDAGGRPLGIVHRDVSPGNVMLLRAGGVKILDFGLARIGEYLRLGPAAAGAFHGKTPYMAPEQVLGKPIDGRADVFALGCVLWEMLVMRPLFWDPDPRITASNLLQAPVHVPSAIRPEIPPRLDQVVMRALARDPAQRFACAADLGHALDRFVGDPARARGDTIRLVHEVPRRLPDAVHWSVLPAQELLRPSAHTAAPPPPAAAPMASVSAAAAPVARAAAAPVVPAPPPWLSVTTRGELSGPDPEPPTVVTPRPLALAPPVPKVKSSPAAKPALAPVPAAVAAVEVRPARAEPPPADARRRPGTVPGWMPHASADWNEPGQDTVIDMSMPVEEVTQAGPATTAEGVVMSRLPDLSRGQQDDRTDRTRPDFAASVSPLERIVARLGLDARSQRSFAAKLAAVAFMAGALGAITVLVTQTVLDRGGAMPSELPRAAEPTSSPLAAPAAAPPPAGAAVAPPPAPVLAPSADDGAGAASVVAMEMPKAAPEPRSRSSRENSSPRSRSARSRRASSSRARQSESDRTEAPVRRADVASEAAVAPRRPNPF